MNDAFMVIAATNDPKVNSTIAAKAKERGLLINAVDQPGDCNFIMPSIVKRGDLHIAISTAGKSPALAKKIRKQMELTFGQEYGAFLELMGIKRLLVSLNVTRLDRSTAGGTERLVLTFSDKGPPGLELLVETVQRRRDWRLLPDGRFIMELKDPKDKEKLLGAIEQTLQGLLEKTTRK